MKVLVLTSSFPTKEGGPHSPEFVANLAQHLPSHGITPVVLAPHFPQGLFREQWNNIKVYRFPYFFPFRFERVAYGAGLLFNVRRDFFAFAGLIPFFLSETVWTIALLFCERADIIHTHWLVPQGLIGALVHRLTQIPHVATIHGSDLTAIKKYGFLKYLGRFIVRNSDIVTVNSSYTREQLLSIVPESARKVRIIPMGVDTGQFRKIAHPSMKEKYRDNRIILSAGRLIDQKGTIYLVDSLPLVLKHHPHTKLLIIGSGPEEERLRNRVRELSLEDHIEFLGTLPHTELIPYYNIADIFVLPSISLKGKSEALGVVLLEAMAAGCPVIGSNVGGIPDIITDCVNGLLVPEQRPDILAEKSVLLLSDESLRSQLRKNGYTCINESFTWENISERFTREYICVLKMRDGLSD